MRILALFLLSYIAFSCVDNLETGIVVINEESFTITRFAVDNSSKKIQVDDVVTLFFSSELETDSTSIALKNTFQNKDTSHLYIDNFRSKGSFADALLHLHVGDSAHIELFSQNITLNNTTQGQRIFMKVKILDAANKFDFDQKLNLRKQQILTKQDKQIIEILTTNSQENYTKIEDGLYVNFIEDDISNEFETVFGDLLKTHLIGMSLSDSSEFENTYSKEQALEFLVGFGSVYQSLEKSALTLSKNDSVHIYYASEHGNPPAYGHVNHEGPFVFQLKIIDIIDGSKKD